ncbi:MAG TPA: YcnI family protein [Nocardioidaceae bacterium]|nr:YcnI family protein [Nocardioidaceae bacterium]
MRRVLAVVAVTIGLMLLGAAAASAHVTVSSPDAEPGGYGKLVFRVPSESDTATTESVTVQLPTDTPFRSVSAKPLAGWTVQTTTEKLEEPVESDGFTITEAVTEVTWTAKEGHGLQPHQFTEFELSVGTFPEGVESLTLPVIQTYSDGEIAAWDQVSTGEEEPDSPAPVLQLGAASEIAEVSSASGASAASDGSGADALARMLGAGGLALGAVALLWTLLARRRSS